MEQQIVRVPRGTPGLEPLLLDLTPLFKAGARLEEIKTASHSKATELMVMYNQAYLAAQQIANKLEYEYQVAVNRLEETKSIILLDEMQDTLKKKGLWQSKNPLGSADIREAVYNNDPRCIRQKELILSIAAFLKQVEGFRKSFEMGYNSAKKVLGDSTFYQNKPNPNLTTPYSGTLDASAELAEDTVGSFFGDPRNGQ